MLGSLDQNGLVERRNRYLFDMVHNMLNNCKFLKSLWTKALKTGMYILNQVPIKAVPKTSFELCKSSKLRLRHIYVWYARLK